MFGLKNNTEYLKICVLFVLIITSLALSGAGVISARRGVLEIYRKGVREDAPPFHSHYVREISFNNYARKVNLIVHHYLRAGYPVVPHFPSHTLEWRAFMEVPESGHYGFSMDASHPSELRVDGEVVLPEPGEASIALHKGIYEFNLKFFNDDGARGVNTVNRQLRRGSTNRGIPTGSLRLLWKTPGGESWEPVPADIFSSGHGSTGFKLPAAFIGLLLAGLLVAADPGFFRGFLIGNRRGIAMAGIAALGFLLRFYQHGIIPVYIETWDEIGAGWSGWSLINTGVPVSWSKLFGAYGTGRPGIGWFGTGFNIVTPFFDHPPLFHVIVGAAAMLGGAGEFFRVSVMDMRIVPVIFSSSVVILLYLILKTHYSGRAALLASFMYAVVPTVVVSGRLVEEDNMMVFLVMLGLFFYIRSLKKETRRAWLPVALCTGFASLAKFTAVSFIGAFSLLYLIRGRWKAALAVFGTGGAIAGLYLVYGAVIDWGMFMKVFSEQGGKIPQFAMPVRLALQPKLVDSVFWDGGVLFLWLSLPALIFLKKGEFSRDLGILFAVYFMLISVTVVTDYGWYSIMMYPFLCAAGGLMLDELLRTRSLLLMALFIGFAVMLNLQAVLPPDALLNPRLPLGIAAAFLLPLPPSHVLKSRRWENAALLVILTAVFVYALTSVIMVIDFAEIYYGDPWWQRPLRV